MATKSTRGSLSPLQFYRKCRRVYKYSPHASAIAVIMKYGDGFVDPRLSTVKAWHYGRIA